MDQPKVQSITQNPSEQNPIESSVDDVKPEVIVVQTNIEKSVVSQEIENGSGDILVDSLKIEPVVTEITTEIIPVEINNDAILPDCLGKECTGESEPSFEVSEQMLEVVCIGQPETSNIDAEVIEHTETLVDSVNEKHELSDVIESEVGHELVEQDQDLSVETVDDSPPEENISYEQENVIAEESCDPAEMSVVEEIVTTSKSAYAVEIQEQDSTDSRENYVTKDLVMLEVISENEESINVVEEEIEEIEIEHTQNCDSSSEKLSSNILLPEADAKAEDNGQSDEEIQDKDESIDVENEQAGSTIVDNTIEDNTKQDIAKREEKEKMVAKATENHRSVIQEIVDDWIDDNNDDICETKSNDPHDSVEIELKSLLAEDKPSSKEIRVPKEGSKFTLKTTTNQGKSGLNLRKSRSNTEFTIKERVNGLENRPKGSKSTVMISENSPSEKGETTSNHASPQLVVLSVTSSKRGGATSTAKEKPQTSKEGVKVTGRNLMSQIASKAEVTEVLKERIKQKQKDIELPRGGDILFVKKITQRLSNKLSAASGHSSPTKKSSTQPLSVSPSENYSNNSTSEKVIDDAEKIESADNRELLAILEGDVDPDWSNLKPHCVAETSKSSEVVPEQPAVTGKLDPLTERELALKQLLELPSISMKKNAMRKKKTFKPATSKVSSNIDQTPESPDVKQALDSETEQTSSSKKEPLQRLDALIEEEDMDISPEDSHMEESRSGRKRKPTEKAREHEQNTTKKQKVYKGKLVEQKKTSKIHAPADELPAQESFKYEDHEHEEEEDQKIYVKPSGRNVLSKIPPTKSRIYQSKSSKIGNKLPQNIVKRNMPVKKLLRQKSSSNVTNSKTAHMKTKFMSSPKKYRNVMKQKIQKRLLEVTSGELKPKKKTNEIDKLLQDEGVVNLLYDVEQPERKRLVPITKSQTKVMDLHKVQRELKIRTKLVRNAVLRLRTSGGSPTKISPRSKRGISHGSIPDNENRENDRNKSTRSSISSNPDFIYPAKIRNAADASVIVRRHSSSSFSSTSGSPRASIEGPEKQVEASTSEEGPAHVTRSARRRYSQNEKNKQFAEVLSTPKKNGVNRKKSVENTVTAGIVSIEKGATATTSRPNLRTESKSLDKTNKNSENIDVGESSSNGSGSKITTRSNGASVEREIVKTRKGTKTKMAGSSKAKDIVDIDVEIIEEDKLSACLAEAASALSNVDGTTSTSASTSVNRKLRTPLILSKTREKSPPDVLDQFSMEEINPRRHGNIVQLILTTSSTKLKNGFTLQTMHELSEALTLLRRDEECRIVLLTTTGTSFCEGLDLSDLIHENKEERRVHAEEMANGVKEFIKTLAGFNKPIVAGIQGVAVGLGVTMLPLFDLVIASDKATFSTPYGKLGQIPEGAAILSLSQTVGNTVTSELLLGGRTLTASEALRAGLVTRVLWPDRFQGELIPSLQAMSEHSSQSMEATKTLLRQSLRKKLDAALESESYLLIQNWCSAECQTLIKSYLDGKGH